MLRQVFLFCFTLPWVVIYSIDVIKDMTVFRQCVHKEQYDTPLAELKPYGSLLCFTRCLQLSSCSHVRLNSKTLGCGIYMASQNVSAGKTKDSESDENWTCRKKVPNSECQPRSRCVKSRNGETKCVHFDIQEHLQRKDRTSTEPGKHSQLFNITERDLKDNWTTTEGPGPEAILSLTWSPSFDNELYGLRREEIGFVIALYMPIGNSLEKQVRWEKVLLPRPNGLGEWTTIDTGLSQTNDTMYCIYLYSMRNSFSDVLMRLRSYREVKIPRHLELEREWDITQKFPTMSFSFMFACDAKLRMALYAQGLFSSTVQKFLIQAGEGAFTLNESETVSRMMAKRIKWLKGGSFAIAVSRSAIVLVRDVGDKEQVVFSVKHTWHGDLTPVWFKTSILIHESKWRSGLLHVLNY